MRLESAISIYLKALEARGYSARTVETYELHLDAFRRWVTDRTIDRIADIGREILRAYQNALMATTSRYNRPLSSYTQSGRVGVVKGFFRFLVQRGVLLVDPAKDLELPRFRRPTVPCGLPTPGEMVRMLLVPDTRTFVGIRDRAVLETLYSTGVRNAELRALKVWDVDLVDGILTVYRGKRQKNRTIPLGREACRWIERYLVRVRSTWVTSKSCPTLFVTSGGKPLDFSNLNKLVRVCARRARVKKRVTVHTYRHACATHMIQAGAGLRHVQKLLGHRSILSTTVYTHLEIRDLKRVHRRCHPRARSTTRSVARSSRSR